MRSLSSWSVTAGVQSARPRPHDGRPLLGSAVHTAPLELSFGRLTAPVPYSIDVGDGSAIVGGQGASCTFPCDTWSLHTPVQVPAQLPISFFVLRFEDQLATQVTGTSFFVPTNRGDWSFARLEIAVYGELAAYGSIDTWNVVPEPGVTLLAALALLYLAAMRSGRPLS